jgi:phosphopantothenoylcysteine decarboxylase / phosphopantothenate---cysteine ligase
VLEGKHILLGVTGGIAAYKSALLVREFIRAGAEVQVVMTRAAAQFVTPLTFGTLSQRDVVMDMYPDHPGETAASWTRHIDLALWGDVMVIAPATANTIAKIVHGLADNFLTSLVLALRCPLVVAPAMDMDMYRNPVTQQNISLLRRRGVTIIEPDTGELASGLSGPGRLPEPAVILETVQGILAGRMKDFAGRKVLVTAGPTHEPLDPVRYLGNRSSGKMGFSIARAAAQRGAEVTLIAGPVVLPTPPHVHRIDVTTAREMHEAVLPAFSTTDVLIMAAAVADFAPALPAPHKIKREAIAGDSFTIECAKNPDILRSAADRKASQVLVGFALETTNDIEHARRKLTAKGLDLIVANNPTEEGAGFGSDTNIVTLITPDGRADRLPRQTKFEIANVILDRIVPMLRSS